MSSCADYDLVLDPMKGRVISATCAAIPLWIFILGALAHGIRRSYASDKEAFDKIYPVFGNISAKTPTLLFTHGSIALILGVIHVAAFTYAVMNFPGCNEGFPLCTACLGSWFRPFFLSFSPVSLIIQGTLLGGGSAALVNFFIIVKVRCSPTADKISAGVLWRSAPVMAFLFFLCGYYAFIGILVGLFRTVKKPTQSPPAEAQGALVGVVVEHPGSSLVANQHPGSA